MALGAILDPINTTIIAVVLIPIAHAFGTPLQTGHRIREPRRNSAGSGDVGMTDTSASMTL
jgi:hypothetical protein